MKAKIAIAIVVCLLVAAQVVFSLSRRPKTESAGEEGRVSAENPHEMETRSEPSRNDGPAPSKSDPDPNGVEEVRLERVDGGILVDLQKTASVWTIANLHSAPADSAKVRRFLSTLLTSNTEGIPADVPPAETGLDADDAIVVKLKRGDGQTAGIRIGLAPADNFDSVYARDENTRTAYVVRGDIRGEMGLWRNNPEQIPDARVWLQTRILTFDPAMAMAVKARYPDHQLEFKRTETGEWALSGTAPGNEWSVEGLAEWLAVLADFRITDVAGSDEAAVAGLETPSHRIEVTLDDVVKTVRACPNRGGDGMWVETSDFPGRIFLLPMWRFRLYFQRFPTLFPRLAPSYNFGDILTIDIRRGGESVKIIKRGESWRAATATHSLRHERITRLARMLAGWRPEDYADPDDTMSRFLYGGPEIEVVLGTGDVYQYRLGGRHPLFPWRYVVVNGTVFLSASNLDASLLFPSFADIMDFGTVFPDLDMDQIAAMEFSAVGSSDTAAPEPEAKDISVRRGDDGAWIAEIDGLPVPLADGEANRILEAPLAWPNAGVFEQLARIPYPQPMRRLRFETLDGREFAITLLRPQARDIPFDDGGARTFLINRSDLLDWLASVQEIAKRAHVEHGQTTPIPAEPISKPVAPDRLDAVQDETAVADEPLMESGKPEAASEIRTASPEENKANLSVHSEAAENSLEARAIEEVSTPIEVERTGDSLGGPEKTETESQTAPPEGPVAVAGAATSSELEIAPETSETEETSNHPSEAAIPNETSDAGREMETEAVEVEGVAAEVETAAKPSIEPDSALSDDGDPASSEAASERATANGQTDEEEKVVEDAPENEPHQLR